VYALNAMKDLTEVSYSSAEAQASCFSDHTRSLPPQELPPAFGSVAEVSISTGVDSDRTDPTITNSMWAKKVFLFGGSPPISSLKVGVLFPPNP